MSLDLNCPVYICMGKATYLNYDGVIEVYVEESSQELYSSSAESALWQSDSRWKSGIR